MGKRFNWSTGKLEEQEPDGAYFHCPLPGCDELFNHRYKKLPVELKIGVGYGAINSLYQVVNRATPKAFQREWKICDSCIKMFYGMDRKDAFYLFASKTAPKTQVSVEEVQAIFDTLVDRRPYYERFYCNASPRMQRYLERVLRYRKFVIKHTLPLWKDAKLTESIFTNAVMATQAGFTVGEIITAFMGPVSNDQEEAMNGVNSCSGKNHCGGIPKYEEDSSYITSGEIEYRLRCKCGKSSLWARSKFYAMAHWNYYNDGWVRNDVMVPILTGEYNVVVEGYDTAMTAKYSIDDRFKYYWDLPSDLFDQDEPYCITHWRELPIPPKENR